MINSHLLKLEPSMFEKSNLSDKEFHRLSEFIHAEYGIKMPLAKKTLLESRLQQRLRQLEIESFAKYCDYLFSNEGRANEMVHFVNKITTNKTDFFREPGHFQHLTQTILPQLIEQSAPRRTLKFWSAGCSTGEEPYTLAMVLNEYKGQHPGSRWDFSILATDLSPEVLNIARTGIYDEERITPIRMDLRKKYLLKHKDKSKNLVRITSAVRNQIQFRRLNFMDRNFNIKERMDLIFCRNVIIYFDKATQEKLINQFCSTLNPNGYIFLGHSESIQGLNVPLTQIFPTIYKKKK
ncbi:MAG: protein-glutamate O-methyltransferase [SAR324 cluster bacterium]|nr:protein-glutamate O-methyltransferase [SAR324 cluster bacterium]